MSGINNLYQTELYLLNAISQLKYEFDKGILNKYTSSVGYSQISTASYNLQLLEQQLVTYAGTTANSNSAVSSIIALLKGLGAGATIDQSLFQNISSLISGSSGSTGLYGALFSESSLKYHSDRFELLTSVRNPDQGQCLVGSLTGRSPPKK